MCDQVRGEGPSSASTIQISLHVCVQWPTEAFLSDSQTQEEMLAELLVGLSALFTHILHSAAHKSRGDSSAKDKRQTRKLITPTSNQSQDVKGPYNKCPSIKSRLHKEYTKGKMHWFSCH